jgi:ketosteroid isomerase-like protein
MRMKHRAIAATLTLLIMGSAVRADDIRPAMEAANAQFMTAFNSPNPAAFVSQYTADSVLLFQGSPPVTGPEAIRQFWEGRIKLGGRDLTFGIIETGSDGRYAWQIAKVTVHLVRDTGEKALIAGNAVRIFEKQSDGTWKTKIHMFNRPE